MKSPDQKLCQLKADVIQAVAHPIRVAILETLGDGELCVCDIARIVGAQRSNVSRHLGVMLQAGVVEFRKDGLKMIYSLATPCIQGFLECVTNVVRERARESSALLRRL
jgi:DNA-binding transcriptional ArsR family regulator